MSTTANSTSTSIPHLRHLERLLDDPSPIVRAALKQEILRLGESGLEWLEMLAVNLSASSGNAAAGLLEEVAQTGAELTFRRFLKGPHLDLETGLILMHRVVDSGLRAREVAGALDVVADRARELLSPPHDPVTTLRALNRVFFHEFGFRGDCAVHADPGTLLIGDVLALRRGAPLPMALCYRLVAARLGLSLEPFVSAERCFLGYLRGGEPFFVNPHERGRFYSWIEAQGILAVCDLVSALAPGPSQWTQVLRLLCMQLRDVFEEREADQRSALFGGFVADLGATCGR